MAAELVLRHHFFWVSDVCYRLSATLMACLASWTNNGGKRALSWRLDHERTVYREGVLGVDEESRESTPSSALPVS